MNNEPHASDFLMKWKTMNLIGVVSAVANHNNINIGVLFVQLKNRAASTCCIIIVYLTFYRLISELVAY